MKGFNRREAPITEYGRVNIFPPGSPTTAVGR
jgi:hypothetical protein